MNSKDTPFILGGPNMTLGVVKEATPKYGWG